MKLMSPPPSKGVKTDIFHMLVLNTKYNIYFAFNVSSQVTGDNHRFYDFLLTLINMLTTKKAKKI